MARIPGSLKQKRKAKGPRGTAAETAFNIFARKFGYSLASERRAADTSRGAGENKKRVIDIYEANAATLKALREEERDREQLHSY